MLTWALLLTSRRRTLKEEQLKTRKQWEWSMSRCATYWKKKAIDQAHGVDCAVYFGDACLSRAHTTYYILLW